MSFVDDNINTIQITVIFDGFWRQINQKVTESN